MSHLIRCERFCFKEQTPQGRALDLFRRRAIASPIREYSAPGGVLPHATGHNERGADSEPWRRVARAGRAAPGAVMDLNIAIDPAAPGVYGARSGTDEARDHRPRRAPDRDLLSRAGRGQRQRGDPVPHLRQRWQLGSHVDVIAIPAEQRVDDEAVTQPGHLIDPDLLRADDFDGFYAARKTALVEGIETAMGKAALRDGTGRADDYDEEQEVPAIA